MANTQHLRNTIGLFVIVGIGLGLSGYIALDFMQTSFVDSAEPGSFLESLGQLFVGLVALQTSFITFLLGSVVAATTGVGSAKSFASGRAAALHNGLAAGVGFPLMVGVAIFIMLLAVAGGGGGGETAAGATTTPTPSSGSGGITDQIDWGSLVMRVGALCIPTALVGAGAGFVGFGFEE